MVISKSGAKYELDLDAGTVRRQPKGEAALIKLWRSMAPAERSSTLGLLDYMRARKRKPKEANQEPQPVG